MADKKKILVLEDEQRAGEKLLALLEGLDLNLEIHWKRSVVDGIAFLRSNDSIDLIFSDIELLDGRAFAIYDEIEPSCPIIFCTAYDNFYVSAFKTNGIAYLLKPYSTDEFMEVWKKYQLLFEAQNTKQLPTDVLTQLQSMLSTKPKAYKESFAVKKRDGVFLLKVAEVLYFQAKGDFVLATDVKQGRHVINSSLSALLDQLDPNLFFQINRSEIVQKEYIAKYASYTKNRLAIHLKISDEVLYTSNSRSSAFRVWFEQG